MSDEELIKGCRKGDALCQKLLVERYASMLLSVARRYMGSSEKAGDVLQDAFVKILTALRKDYSHQGKLEGWMRTIVIHTAINETRRNRRAVELRDTHLPGTAQMPPEAYHQMGTDELMKLVESLPEGYRQVFNLAVIECYPHSEIAAVMGISESTSRSQLVRARQMLQEKIMQLENIRI